MTNDFWDDQDGEIEKNEKKRLGSPHKLVRSSLMALGALSLIGLGALGVYWGVKQKPEWFGIKNESISQPEAQKEIESLTTEVGKLIELPQGEVPTLATVSDIEKVKDQQFFARAQNGDKVLVYQAARKAYLYRPGENKIIEVGVVGISQTVSGTPVSSTPVIPTLTPEIVPTVVAQ